MHISARGGKARSWFTPPTFPVYADTTTKFQAGNVAVGAVGKVAWISSYGGPLGVTVDGGKTWLTTVHADTAQRPNFRHTEGGALVDMSTAYFHHDYTLRRKVLVADPTVPGRLWLYCSGLQAGTGGNHANMVGIWRSDDYGLNWLRTRSSPIVSHSADFYGCRLRLMPGAPNAFFWVSGKVDGPAAAGGGLTPSADGLYYTADQGAAFATMPGWAEAEDIAFTQGPAGGSIRAWVVGYRGGVLGVYYSDNLMANPLTATWTMAYTFPEGRHQRDSQLFGALDSTTLNHIVAGGGVYAWDEQVGGKPVRVRAS